MPNKVLFITFAYLDNEKAGPGKITFSLIKKFLEKGVEVETICLGYSKKISSISSYRFFSPPHSLLYKIVRKIFYLFRKSGIILPERRITEVVFDFFISISNKLKQADCILEYISA